MTARERERLPNHRAAVAFEFVHDGHRYRAHVGRFPSGGVAELFLDGARPNSALDALAADSAILISLLLQHGASPDQIAHALRCGPDGQPASLIGAAVDLLRKEAAR
jgi:hypothetical protein